jgi:Domain of unknown function (DUF5916)/Carbohydrate family 9 binding domain-like
MDSGPRLSLSQMLNLLSSAAFPLAIAMSAAAAPNTPPSAVAVPVPEATAIKLDGELSEAVWEHAPAITDFRQRDPKEGAMPTFATDVRIAYDATTMYVAVVAHDSDPSRIVGLRTRRDTSSPSDWIRVMIDSFHDRRSAFEFAVNPAGVKLDKYWFDDGNSDDIGWDAVWDVAVSKDAAGWRAEFRIPFSQLRFRQSDATTFGFAVVRTIGRLNETDTWPLLAKSANGFVSSFGDLTGLRVDGKPKRLEVVPYAVAQVATNPPADGNPLIPHTDPGASVGVDLKYAVRPGMTLTATVNPDFGQVEADPAVVNLSGFETFFSERRPFFVEGSGMFQFNVDCNDGQCSGLFYSRRIGRAPRGEPSTPVGGYASSPAQTTILGAAKLTGRAGKFSIGAMNAITADEDATIAVGPVRLKQSVEPLTSYSIVRARREFDNQSSLGFIGTSTNRRLTADTSFLPANAFTGGVDWDWRVWKRYAVQGYWAGSEVQGDAAAIGDLQQSTVHSFQRPDADHLEYDPTRTSLGGYGAMLALAKIGGERVRFNSNVAVKSPGFDINDVGYMRRADQRTMSNWMQWRNERPSKYLRSFRFNLNQWAGWNYGGDRLYAGYNVNAHWMFVNNWATGMGANYNPRGFDDRATRGGPGAYNNRTTSLWQYVESDNRRPVSASYFFNIGSDRKGTRWIGVSPEITWRASTFLSASGGFRWSHELSDAQWVENTADGHYVFGHLDQTTVSLTARVNYTITPQLSIQIYAAPFVSAGDYGAFKELVDGRADRYEDRYQPYAYQSNPDFDYRSFRTTNVLRWEYKPGSVLFVVWQQGREDTIDQGRFGFGRDFGGIFSTPSRNVFLVKLSYWLNP